MNALKHHILLVEDDRQIQDSLREYLQTEGYIVSVASGQTEALKLLQNCCPFDLILLDIFLQDGNGRDICVAIRQQYDVPVIFLTASADESSIVEGFDLGACDYISKPFRPRELVSRIRNALRSSQNRSLLSAGDLTLDVSSGTVYKQGKELVLSALEYRILYFLLSNKGILLTREKLLEEIWDIAGDFVNDNTLTVYIKRIREKVEEDPSCPKIIKTVRGLGYRIDG